MQRAARKIGIMRDYYAACPYEYGNVRLMSREAHAQLVDLLANDSSAHVATDVQLAYVQREYVFVQLAAVQITLRRVFVSFDKPSRCLVCGDSVQQGWATIQLVHGYCESGGQPVQVSVHALCRACASRRLREHELNAPPARTLPHAFMESSICRFIEKEVLPHQDTPVAMVDAVAERAARCVCCHHGIDIDAPDTYMAWSGWRHTLPGCHDTMFLLLVHAQDACMSQLECRLQMWEQNAQLAQKTRARETRVWPFHMRAPRDHRAINPKFVDYYHVFQWTIMNEKETLARLERVSSAAPVIVHKCAIPTCACNMFTEHTINGSAGSSATQTEILVHGAIDEFVSEREVFGPHTPPSPKSVADNADARATLEHASNELSRIRSVLEAIEIDSVQYPHATAPCAPNTCSSFQDIYADVRQLHRVYDIPDSCYLLTFMVFRLMRTNPYEDVFLTEHYYGCTNCSRPPTITCPACGLFRFCCARCENKLHDKHRQWCHRVSDSKAVYSLFYIP